MVGVSSPKPQIPSPKPQGEHLGIWASVIGTWALLEGQAETKLHRAWCVREVRARVRFAVIHVRLGQVVAGDVRPVEQVEHLETPIERRFAVQRNALQEPQLHAMERRADEAVARNDAAVRPLRVVEPQSIDASDLQPARIAAADDLAAKTGPVEIDAARLESAAHLPDAVEHRTVALIGGAQCPLTRDIRRDLERHLPE